MLITSRSLLICNWKLLEETDYDFRNNAGLGGLLKKSE